MSEEEDGEKKRRRKPLSRSRRLSSRRRRGRKKEEEEEAKEEGGEDGGEAAPEAEAEESTPPEETAADPSDQTVPVSRISSPAGRSGTPQLDQVPPPPTAEKMAKLKGSMRRFSTDFSRYLLGLGKSAHASGVDFGEKVVRPFSHALFEAAICISLLFLAGAAGVMFGGYLKTVTAKGSDTVSFSNREVRPGQQIDESFFSQGFDTRELHQRANRVLDNHLRALKKSDFTEAYTLLSPEWRSQLSFKTFESGYTTTKILAYEIGKVETLDSRRIRLRAKLKVEELGKEKIYNATYIAVLSADGWRLDGGTFN